MHLGSEDSLQESGCQVVAGAFCQARLEVSSVAHTKLSIKALKDESHT